MSVPQSTSTSSPSSSSPSQNTTDLMANYLSQHGTSTTLSHTLAAPASEPGAPLSTAARTTYLHDLRKHVVQLQGEINTFLTQKMEEDAKAASAAAASALGSGGAGAGGAAGNAGKTAAEEEEERARKEEENYGEEVVEED